MLPLEVLPGPAPARRWSGCETGRPMRISLVNMPWARVDAPSIQCGLLKAELTAFGHQVDIAYPNLDLAAKLGPKLYEAVTNAPSERIHLFGEWLFGCAAFPEQRFDLDGSAYRAEFPEVAQSCKDVGLTWEEVCELRATVLPGWIESLARDVDWSAYALVGFTSTFVQNVAALALARSIKERHPAVKVVMGGANYDGTMGPEFVRSIGWIDYAVIGEGDLALPRLAAALANGVDPLAIPGVCGRDGAGDIRFTEPERPVRQMNEVPPPDYDEYFATLDRVGRDAVLDRRPPRLLIELSRGCWWGEKHHCTFCGLNALGMQFRAKPPASATQQLEALVRRYRVRRVDAVDNILDMAYLNSFCTELAAAGWDVELFFEVKANLTAAQLGTLAAAGVRQLQPGLESLNSAVLALMRKGSTKLLNIRLLKWARYHGMHVSWNLLTGFPGETAEHYTQQIALMPALAHLEPPSSLNRIWLERFSPYFTDASLGITEFEPRAAYRYAYPVPGIDHRAIAYFFDYPAVTTGAAEVAGELATAVEAWQAAWARRPRPELVYFRGPGWLTLRDTRGTKAREAELVGWQADALLCCDETARTPERVHENLRARYPDLTPDRIRDLLQRLVRQSVCVSEDGRYLSLAMPARRPR